MSDLTALTIAGIRDGLAAKSFSATELAKAYLANMEKARTLNAYLVETPEKAPARAAEPAHRSARRCGCWRACRSARTCSPKASTPRRRHVLDGFRPTTSPRSRPTSGPTAP